MASSPSKPMFSESSGSDLSSGTPSPSGSDDTFLPVFDLGKSSAISAAGVGFVTEMERLREGVRASIRLDDASPFLRYDADEPMLTGSKQLSALPHTHVQTYENYLKHRAAFWTEGDINFEPKDRKDWDTMRRPVRQSTTKAQCFFHVADEIVAGNLSTNFCNEMTCWDACNYAQFQLSMENIHNSTYARVSHFYIAGQPYELEDCNGADLLQEDAILRMPCVRSKVEWALRNTDPTYSCFAERKFSWALTEGVHFSSAFTFFNYLRNYLKVCPALGQANILISRDEGLHCSQACMEYRTRIRNKLPVGYLHEKTRSAVEAEFEFIADVLPNRLEGCNSKVLQNAVKRRTDAVLADAGLPQLYFVKDDVMVWEINEDLHSKPNQFERRGYNYANFNSITQEKAKLAERANAAPVTMRARSRGAAPF